MTLFFIRIQGYIAPLFNEILSQNTKEREREKRREEDRLIQTRMQFIQKQDNIVRKCAASFFSQCLVCPPPLNL